MHPAEIKIWLRKKLLAYRFAELSSVQHLAIIEEVAEELESFINHPDDTVRLPARSVAQYMAQSGLRPIASRLITELMSYVLLPVGIAFWVAEGFRHTRSDRKTRAVRWNQLEYRYKVNQDVYQVPTELVCDEPKTVFARTSYLRVKDALMLWAAIRAMRPILPALWSQWAFKVAKEMAWARALLDAHPAEYAMIDAEYDCALSMMTLMARKEGQGLYNVMHGDRGRIASDAFFEVDRCYCWHKFYAEQFRLLRARADFRIYTNPNFLLSDKEKAIKGQGIGVFMPIEQTIPTAQDVQHFVAALNELAERHTVHLRPHPMEVHQCDRVRSYLSPKVIITDPREENSRQFILKHAVLVGSVSTALLESIMLGRHTVIFSSRYSDDLLSYHYAYKEANSHTCRLEDLSQAVEKCL